MIQQPEESVAAVVPLYLPGLDFRLNLQALQEQVAKVVIVDDSPCDWDADVIERMLRPSDQFIRYPGNLGIAHALNVGTYTAFMNESVRFVVTVDQDSRLGRDYVSTAVDTFKYLNLADDLAAVAAGSIRNGSGAYLKQSEVYSVTLNAFQSGLMVSRSSFARVGGFDDTLFIDGVDTDWGLRASSMGMKVVRVASCEILHALGVAGSRRPLRALNWLAGRSSAFPVHTPARNYYIARNRARLLQRYARRFPYWSAHSSINQLRVLLLTLIHEPGRLRLLIGITFAMRDVAAGRTGPMSPRIARLLG